MNKFVIVPEEHLRHYKNNNDGKINIIIRFLRSPVNFHADPKTGFLKEIQLQKNRLEGTHYRQVDVKDDSVPEWCEKADVVIRCVGYRSVPIPGVSFDFNRYLVPNSDGCVLTEPNSKFIEVGHFASGWCKTGANGGLFSVLSEVEETCNNFNLQAETGKLDLLPDPDMELKRYFDKHHQGYVSSFEDWFRVDAEERRRGEKENRIRRKLNQLGEISEFLTR